MIKKLSTIVLVSALSIPLFGAEFITIGTGGVTGTYYPTGGAVCHFINKIKNDTGIRCLVESTKGSVYNVDNIRNGKLDFGIAQSDVVHYALHGQKDFKDNPYKDIKSVIAIYPELLALVVRKNARIKSITDIKGKKINVDVPGSGTRLTTEIVMHAEGLSTHDLALTSELKSTQGPNLLKERKIDGYFGVFGHPTANIKDAANSTSAYIVPIKGKNIDALISKYPYYAKGIISGTFYKGINNDTPSIGVKAVLVTSDKVSEKTVYILTKTILDNFYEFKKLHPTYKTITKKSLLDGLSAPQHSGAIKAFKEAGLL